MYILCGFIILIIIVVLLSRKESFVYPAYIQQPLGPRGWGYRDPCATYQTLLWEQSRPVVRVEKPQRKPFGYWNKNIDTEPVPKKCSPFDIPQLRPQTIAIQQRPQAQSLYANWASSLQA